jgi:hypothetical protein
MTLPVTRILAQYVRNKLVPNVHLAIRVLLHRGLEGCHLNGVAAL